MADRRSYDLVLLGATGFAGGLTAGYLARHVPAGCRWALAGRDETRLRAVRARLLATDPGLAELPLLHADVGDPDSMQTLARSSRVVASTVGPYVEYGEPLVAACAGAGTDYVDLTGEPEFVDAMYVRHHHTAESTGARLVHACGFDSVPHDLGVRFTVRQLPAGVPLRVTGRVRSNGSLSAGTFHSAVTALSRGRQLREVSGRRRSIEPRPDGRRVTTTARPHREDGYWMVPLPTVDPQVVKRSARADDRYGPDFAYGHYAGVRRLPVVLAGAAGMAGVVAAAQVPALRHALLGRMQPGQGPSPARRAASWFQVRFVGVGGGRRVVTEVAGGDPGYDETAKMLAEAALCLAFDENPSTSGQVTTATAMGRRLTDRLVRAGVDFRVLEQGPG